MHLHLKGSIISQVDTVIQEAIKCGVSDIHIEPYEKKVRVRFRVDGQLIEVVEIPIQQKDAIVSRIKVMASLDIAEKRRPQDGRIKIHKVNDIDIDLRISILPVQFGEKVVIRILDSNKLKLDLATLGFEHRELEKFKKAIMQPFGLILVTGPTGSGKSTTLYSALNEINTPEKNIITIEDPIEYNLMGINQSQVHEEIGLTFASILRSILRQDPNVVMVGEIRDKETAEIAIRASLTGHLVFSTLHTNDSISAISRLIDMGVAPFLIAASLKLVVAQRLVRKLCSSCTKYDEKTKMYSSIGCKICNETGYRGRTSLIEILDVTQELASLISNNYKEHELRERALQLGLHDLKKVGAIKIKQGITLQEEVNRETIF
jgi:type IV pilus assembly protein PilB